MLSVIFAIFENVKRFLFQFAVLRIFNRDWSVCIAKGKRTKDDLVFRMTKSSMPLLCRLHFQPQRMILCFKGRKYIKTFLILPALQRYEIWEFMGNTAVLPRCAVDRDSCYRIIRYGLNWPNQSERNRRSLTDLIHSVRSESGSGAA